MRIKKNLFIWLFIFIFLSTYSLESLKKKISIFLIDNINIDGVVNVNKLELENKLSQFYGESLIFLNRKKFNEIGNKFGFINEIKIKKIYPNTLNITVKENKPLGIFVQNNKKILLLEMGNEISNFDIEKNINLLLVKGVGAKKEFHNFYKTLNKTNFDINSIQELKYFNINRWDIILKSGKIIKLPTQRFDKAIKKFISIYNEDNFDNFKIFDFRINGQLILK